MRALVVTQEDQPVLRLREVPEPTASAGEVEIRTLVSTINRGERSRLASAPDGHVFGWDVVGELVADCPPLELPAGAVVVALAGAGGGWAERACARASDATAVPLGVPVAAAATLPVAGLTALRAVNAYPNLLGAHVLVTGAGAVASYAVQLACLAGAIVHAVVRSAESARHLASLGVASATLADEKWPGGFDLVVDTVGGALLPRSVAAARAFGEVVVVGNLGGLTAGVTSGDLLGSGAKVRGYRLVVDAELRPVGHDLGVLVQLVAEGRLITPDLREVDWTDTGLVDSAIAEGFGRARPILIVGSA
jgi:NADPH:quinone reductase-like Zn-dependent oxidoreductase